MHALRILRCSCIVLNFIHLWNVCNMHASCNIFISLHYTREVGCYVLYCGSFPGYHPSLQCIELVYSLYILTILHAGLEQANKIASQHNFVGACDDVMHSYSIIHTTPAMCWHAKYNEPPYIIKPDRNTFIHLQLFPCAQEEGLMVRWRMPTEN